MTTKQQQTSQSDEKDAVVCSACHLPATSPSSPLKACTRCHSAWYHNVQCQRSHYPQHKALCRKFCEQQKEKKKNIRCYESYCVRQYLTKGRYLQATTPIAQWQSLLPPSSMILQDTSTALVVTETTKNKATTKRGYWQPLVAPVLHESHRSTHCAFCFGILLPSSSAGKTTDKGKNTLHVYCSSACRRRKTTRTNTSVDDHADDVSYAALLLQWEETVIRQLRQLTGGPPRIFSTALLLFRLVVTIASTTDNKTKKARDVWELQSESSSRSQSSTTDKGQEQQCHQQAVLATVVGMIQQLFLIMQSSSGTTNDDKRPSFLQLNPSMIPSQQEMIGLLHRIQMNGFSVVNGEFESLGIGLFERPSSFMNHSCQQQNVVQTFDYGHPGYLPHLMLTAVRPIAVGDELCISYIDLSLPHGQRQEQLEDRYHFVCDCIACTRPSMTGLQCPYDYCKSTVNNTNGSSIDTSAAIQIIPQVRPAPDRYRCSRCNQDVPTGTVTTMMNEANQLAIHQGDSSSQIESLQDRHVRLATFCTNESWWMQELREALIAAYLEQLSPSSQQDQTVNCGYKALRLLDEQLQMCQHEDGDNASSSGPRILLLPKTLTLYKAAKLRLFLQQYNYSSSDSQPPSISIQQAIDELQQVKNVYARFYPSHHQVMTGITACLNNLSV